MKKGILRTSCCLLTLAASLCACSKTGDANTLVFSQDKLVLRDFDGLGVEWGAYEDTDKLVTGAWEKIESLADRLRPSMVRCMINYDWFVQNFDNKGDTDKNNDTWSYNFANKYMNSAVDVLTYCEEHSIDVAFGCWNVVGNFSNDVWGMMDEVTSDIRWAKITGDVLEYLVKDKGFTCIKYFVNSNEPNYRGTYGSSKNYNNTFEIWSQGVKNVRAELDRRGLANIGIVGGDTTGFEGSKEYLGGISRNQTMKNSVGDYGCHVYASNYYIDKGLLTKEIKGLADEIKANDSEFNGIRKSHIWEAGLVDGKNTTTDCNAYITGFSYGIRMADYTIQCVLGGINGIVYWDFDDAMHFMYQGDGTVNPKEWGMFSTLASASPSKQEVRPWYHSSTLLTNLMRPGSRIYDSGFNDPEADSSFRSLGVINKGNKSGGYIAVNRGIKEVEKTFVIDERIEESGKLYIYFYNEKSLLLDSDGFVKPNYVIDGSLNKTLKLSIPANTLAVVSSEVL